MTGNNQSGPSKAPDRWSADADSIELQEPRAMLLLLGKPADVLERIVPGDPLELASFVEAELREAAYVMDAESVLRRAFARCAHEAVRWRGRPGLATWLAARVREAIEDVRRAESPPRGSARSVRDDAFRWIADPLGLEAEPMRRACVRFNALEREERYALLRVLVEGESLEELVRETGLSLPEVARRVRRGLESFRNAFAPSPGSSAGVGA